jgi:hypothetical protein
MTANHDPSLPLSLPGHGIATDHALNAFIIFLYGKNEILDNSDVLMNLDIDGPQLTYRNLRRLAPKPDPFLQPRPVDVDGALMSEADEIGMDIFQEFFKPAVNQMIPMVFQAPPDTVLPL